MATTLVAMATKRTITAAEMELMSPDERARLVKASRVSLDDLDPAFRERVVAKGRRIASERGLVDPKRS